MNRSKPELENQKPSLSSESVQERGNHIIVSAAGGILVGAVLGSIGLSSVVTGAVVGAIVGAAIGSSFSSSQSTDKEITKENEHPTK